MCWQKSLSYSKGSMFAGKVSKNVGSAMATSYFSTKERIFNNGVPWPIVAIIYFSLLFLRKKLANADYCLLLKSLKIWGMP